MQKKYDEAEILLRYVVKEYERASIKHPDALAATAHLVQSLIHKGQRAEAEALRKRVYNAALKIFGDESPWEFIFPWMHTPRVTAP